MHKFHKNRHSVSSPSNPLSSQAGCNDGQIDPSMNGTVPSIVTGDRHVASLLAMTVVIASERTRFGAACQQVSTPHSRGGYQPPVQTAKFPLHCKVYQKRMSLRGPQTRLRSRCSAVAYRFLVHSWQSPLPNVRCNIIAGDSHVRASPFLGMTGMGSCYSGEAASLPPRVVLRAANPK